MLVHWKELNQFFTEPLPAPEAAVMELNGRSCEIESVKPIGDDWTLDVKVLPDRPDAKTHEGFARELSAIMGWPMKKGLALVADKKNARAQVQFTPQKINEILGLPLSGAGEREVEKSLASHKSFLRTNLSDALRETLLSHLDHALFETEAARVFEIGTVFFKDREELHLAAGIAYNKEKYKKESLPSWFPHTDWSQTSVICEMPLGELVSVLAGKECPDIVSLVNLDVQYRSFSLYPRIIRDIALFVPSGVRAEEVESVIRENAGPLLAEGPVKFDEFSKEGESRTSLAFRIAFQSHKKTLSDAEANEALSSIVSALEKHPLWQVRK